jgi:hypothetical protein
MAASVAVIASHGLLPSLPPVIHTDEMFLEAAKVEQWVTCYVALPCVASDDGAAPGEAVECLSANAAVMRALSRKPGHAGALAFSRTGAPSTGDFGEAKVIRKFGDVPDDLSEL